MEAAGADFARTRSARHRKMGYDAGLAQVKPDGRKTDRRVSAAARRKEARNPIARSEFRFKGRKRGGGN